MRRISNGAWHPNDVFKMGALTIAVGAVVVIWGLTPVVGMFFLSAGVILLVLGALTA